VVVGAVVWLPDSLVPDGINDSKKLTKKRRHELAPLIWERAHCAAVGAASANEIDEWGIRTAQAVAAQRALDRLSIPPTMLILDGPTNFVRPPSQPSLAAYPLPASKWTSLPATCVVKGDNHSLSVAAAAIIAKVWRDEYMHNLDHQLPGYEFHEHVGYGTTTHRDAIAKIGPSIEHRQTWRLLA
jgi:ribonuclease HII